ncbi:MAG: hypothetical protein COU11_03555 [Candidatus Harrisonbacteria bacterium CG10_big_fil_rev_8_21_14_0_10_49_15]|uniref:ZIP family metal transporter n=1 Tax=Candidatus Harrisonbacteria bacterium CG10_big_fil_rev_8_21_14_0_10_49_15 TaxID=1974587 RepID=A0A2H0UKH1_9BACT|nr:MAG: hypothetical protein COU11_03555 [Candidatus Harrisonbacteria bacterium CG10_big_fil_rev_8_21_14_0_10_49_15]
MELIYIVIALLAVSGVSLVGLLLLPLGEERFKHISSGLAVVMLLGAAALDLLPEALEMASGSMVAFWLAVGFFLSVVLRRFVGHEHRHDHSGHGHKGSLVGVVLFGDALHNFMDGALIGLAFLASTEVGIAATVAVMAHEIPQEIADFGILLGEGLSRARALFLNFMSALVSLLGGVGIWFSSQWLPAISGVVIPLVTGTFLYIAFVLARAMWREFSEPEARRGHLTGIGVGFLILVLLLTFVPEDDHGQGIVDDHEDEAMIIMHSISYAE